MVAETAIPRNWQDFLRVDSNKTELFRFLSHALLMSFDFEDKQLVITDGESVLSKPPLQDTTSLAPCNHEEADIRMLLHVAHAAHHNDNKILIRTVDTAVVVLAVSVVQCLEPVTELWLAFGTGKSFRYLAAHTIAHGLGPNKARALPMLHSLSGCDTVSSFVGHGKKTAWKTWKSLPELTDVLLKLASAPSVKPEDVMPTIERFVILLYDRCTTKNILKEAKCETNSANKSSSRATCEASHVPRRPCMGTDTASQSNTSFTDQLGLDQDR